MKLYLSSYRIPNRESLEQLLGRPLAGTTVALITNAKDYYIERARNVTVSSLVDYMHQLGMTVTTIDLREYSEPAALKVALAGHDLVWAMGGNTYMLRYEMRRSGFDQIIAEMLDSGVVFGGDSAGALVAGVTIAGVELADEPLFAVEVINEGLNLVPYAVLPHTDNPEFADMLPVFRAMHQDKDIIELTDSQAAVFNSDHYVIAEAPKE